MPHERTQPRRTALRRLGARDTGIAYRKRPSARLRVGALLLLAPLACLAGPHELKLGIVAPPGQEDSASLVRGACLAVADSNEATPGIVTLEVRGEAGQWGSAGNDAVFLARDRMVDAIIAPSDGGDSHLVLQVSGRTQVPVASVSPDSSVTEAGVPWAVRVVPRTDQEVEALFESQKRGPHAPTWWAIAPPDRPGRAIRRDLGRAVRATHARLERILETGGPGLVSIWAVQPILYGSPDGVLVWLPPSEAGRVVAALRASGYRGCIAGPGSIDAPDFFAAAGVAANGVLVAKYELDPGSCAKLELFKKRFTRMFGAPPNFSAAAAYDAAQVLIENLRRAGDTPAYRRFPPVLPTAGVTGVLHFDNSGNRTDALQVLTCQVGRFVPLPLSEIQP
jgi:ABC-type branched-subunit amino acid transport system substrate-binding protein